jgi:hypothetical protein
VRAAYSDRFVDLVGEGFDAAVRLGFLPDSSLVARRICVIHGKYLASPSYIAIHGAPETRPDGSLSKRSVNKSAKVVLVSITSTKKNLCDARHISRLEVLIPSDLLHRWRGNYGNCHRLSSKAVGLFLWTGHVETRVRRDRAERQNAGWACAASMASGERAVGLKATRTVD